MRETNILNNLNCKMQAHVRVYEENIENRNNAYWNKFMVKDVSLKTHIGRVGRCIKMTFSRMIHHNIKVLASIVVSKVLMYV